MAYTFTFFWMAPGGELEPLYDIPLPPLPFPSVEAARGAAMQLVTHPDIPAHSLTIDSDDGSVSERWFVLDGQWRRKKT